MSLNYRGKLFFSQQELTTKYDKIAFKTTLNFASLNNQFNKRFLGDIKSGSNSQGNIYKSSLKEWIDLQNEDFTDFDSDIIILKNNYIQERECNLCISPNINLDTITTNPVMFKVELINLISESIMTGHKDISSYLTLCTKIINDDPEYVLKASLYCRRELNVRSISNFLLGLSAYINQSREFLKKYFYAIINLPTDWIEVVYYYMMISGSSHLPNQLRKVLSSKFRDFTLYQLGKYHNKKMNIELQSKKIKLTLKSIVRILHISEPVEFIMSLLGKQYPVTKEEFYLSKLPNQWDEARAGKRMKIPTPDTWETQISIHGNKPEIWQKLIDNKSLPYMATIRNLRNFLQSNIKDSYHIKVAKFISKESNVIKGKLLPFQYFTAYKILEEYNENILKAEEKFKEITSNKTKFYVHGKKNFDQKARFRKIVRLKKIMLRSVVSENVIKRYNNAINTAIEISTIYNIPPIKGKVLILSDINENMALSSFKYGSTKTVKEVIALLTSMCSFASENSEIYLVKNYLATNYRRNSKHKSILKMSTDILSYNEEGKSSPDNVLHDMITNQIQFDMILTFDVNLSEEYVTKYIRYVNPSVLMFINSLKSNKEKTINVKLENIVHIQGFSDHTIKIISEYNNGNIFQKINLIDEKFNLCDNWQLNNSKSVLINSKIHSNETIQSEINIFISSTFMDMDKERNIINKLIFPSVKKNILLNVPNIDINCIDLRWGVPSHWGRSEKLLQYCIEQVKRCHVFVGILGFRYGWIPDSKIIKNVSELYPELKNYEGLSITNIEYKFASSNCHKIFLLKSERNELCFDISELKLLRNTIVMNECYYEYSVENMLNDFKVLIPHLTKTIFEDILKSKMNELKICEYHQAVLRPNKITEETRKFMKHYSENFESFKKEEVNELITILQKKMVFKMDDYSAPNYSKINIDKGYASLDMIKQNSGGLLIIEGKPGSGKTSILTELMLEYSSNYKTSVSKTSKILNFVWIFDVVKFINIEKFTDLYFFDLLHDIIEFFIVNLENFGKNYLKKDLAIYNDIRKDEFWRPTDLKSALLIWNIILKKIKSINDLDVTLFIDGLDNLKDFSEAATLNWIPLILPSKFHIILTTLCNSQLSKCSKLRENVLFHEVWPIPLAYKRRVIENMLQKIGKSLESIPFDDYISNFVMKRDSNQPLYLKIAINHLVLHTTFGKVKEEIKNLPSTLDYLIIHTLKSIENELPKEICFVFFAFLYNSRTGFKKEDLQVLLSIYFRVAISRNTILLVECDYPDLKKVSKLPLCFPLYPIIYIKNLSNLLLDEDEHGRILIKDIFIKSLVLKYISVINKKIINYIISIYYEDMLQMNDKIAYRDIIYHKYASDLLEECAEFLTDSVYLKTRFNLGISEGLLNDFIGYKDINKNANEKWHEICNRPIMRDFHNFIASNFQFLKKYPDLFTQQALNEPQKSYVYEACQKIILAPFNFTNSKSVILKFNNLIINKTDISSVLYRMGNKISCVTVGLKLNLLAVCYESGLIQIFNLNTYQVNLDLRKHVSKVNKTFFFDNDTKLISVGEDCLGFIWDVFEGSLLKELKSHFQPITDCTFSKRANKILTASLDCQFIIWKTETFVIDHIFKTKSPINCVTSHPINDFKVIIGCWNGTMIIYNLFDYKKIAVIHDYQSIKSISFHPSYDLFLSTTITGQISVWNSRNGVKIKNIVSENNRYSRIVRYSSNGSHFFDFSGEKNRFFGLNIWSTSLGYDSDTNTLLNVTCIDSNDLFIFCGTKFGKIIVLSSNFLKKLEKTLCDAEITSISANHSNHSNVNHCALVDYNKIFYIIQILEDDIIVKFKVESLHSRAVNVLSLFSSYLISGSDDCSVGILKIENNFLFLPMITNIFMDSILTIDVCDNHILVGCKDRSIGYFHLEKSLVLNHEIRSHNDWVTTVCFISSERFISGSNDFTLKVWSIVSLINYNQMDFEITNDWCFKKFAEFNVLYVLKNHLGSITSISFNKENLFASSSQDGTIKIWSTDGHFIDNIIFEKDFSVIPEASPILWIKFLSEKTLFAFNSKSELQLMDFKRSCLINTIYKHHDPVISVFDFRSDLYSISVDGAMRKWSLQEIFKKKFEHCEKFKITHSLYFSSIFNVDDLIISISDIGIILFVAKNKSSQVWQIIDRFNVKKHYDTEKNINEFLTPYLFCSNFEKLNKYEIIMTFGNFIFQFNLCSKSIKRVNNYDDLTLNIESESKIINIFEMIFKEEIFEIMQNDSCRYFLKLSENAKIMELLSIKSKKENYKVLSKIPVNGIPCHIMMFHNSQNEYELFIGYVQGNIDIVNFKQLI